MGYKVQQVVLIKSDFWRGGNDVLGDKLTPKMDIVPHTKQLKPNIYQTVLECKVVISAGDNQVMKVEVAFAGIFEYPESESERIPDFDKVNAPAIIFPYIRQHIATLTVLSGMPPFLLPPVNFVARASDK